MPSKTYGSKYSFIFYGSMSIRTCEVLSLTLIRMSICRLVIWVILQFLISESNYLPLNITMRIVSQLGWIVRLAIERFLTIEFIAKNKP